MAPGFILKGLISFSGTRENIPGTLDLQLEGHGFIPWDTLIWI